MKIPDVVHRTIELHEATARLELARVESRLMELPALSAEGRRLRMRREQLTDESRAWSAMAAHAAQQRLKHQVKITHPSARADEASDG